MTPSGIKPATFRCVAQYIKQLHPPPFLRSKVRKGIKVQLIETLSRLHNFTVTCDVMIFLLRAVLPRESSSRSLPSSGAEQRTIVVFKINIVLGYGAVKVAENHRGFKTICCLYFHSFGSTKFIYNNTIPSAGTLGMCN